MSLQRRTDLWHKLLLQPQRAVMVLACLVALMLCALVARDLQRDYEQQFAAAGNKTSSLTQMLEEHARQSMRRVELALSLAAQEVQTQTQGNGRISAATAARLGGFLPQDGLLASFAVLDAKGQTVASTLTDKPGELPSAQDRDFFLAQQDPVQSGLFVGAAVKSRISGLWIIPVSVRLQGGFVGTLMAAVDPEYFQRFYQSIETGEDGFVTLFTTQGWAVARWPFNSEIAERNWKDSPLFQQHLPGAREATIRQKLAFSGVDSVYSYRELDEYPLVVALGMSLDETMLPWRERAWLECGGLLLVLISLGGATRLLTGQLRRRVQAESALQLSEISVLKSSLPTLWIGADARILRVNQAACDLHGYIEADMLRMTVPDLNPNMPMGHWTGHWQRLREQHHLHFETQHRHRQGHEIAVEVELNFIEFDGQEYNFAFIRDLTLRKQDEAQIQRSADLLRGAIDAVDEAFVLFDQEDRLVYCNAKYVELYRELQDQLQPGARFEDLIRLGAQRGLYRDSLGREEAWVAERLKAHLDGNETRVQKRDDGRVLRVIDRKTPDGNIVGIRVDITEMVRATEEAQEASRTKSQFLANMSHEIRTPMNAILGLLALLQNTDLSATQRDYATKTTSAAQSLLGLLNDILDFSKVEAGKMELDPQPFRLDRLLRDIAVILSTNLGGKPVEVLFDMGADVPSVVVADAMRLQQVLVNLGSNAIKFTEQGHVVLRVRQQPVAADATDEEGVSTCKLEFAIQDSGIGIAPDKQQHIFTGFSQAEASTTRRYGGTGLGLAICKRLVELMGGTLALQSTPGLGSTFSFILQLPRVGEVPAELADAPRLSVAPKRVLIVDDNPVARDILASMTRAWNWPTTLASSGLEAVELLRTGLAAGVCAFDVVYLDWQMPDMDGWEVAQQMRDVCSTAARAPRLVMLSANGRDTPMLRTLQEQALIDGFLFKPVTASSLQDAANGHSSLDARLGVRPRSSRALAGLRILVVEDNLINQQVAEELLNAEGALVALAANGQLGVDAVTASQPPFDVVLMDLQMPVLDGYGATRKIRQELGLTQLPIVAMTANAMASDRQACLAAGMNEHVGKPFDMAHLVAVLRKVVGLEAVPAEAAQLAVVPATFPDTSLAGATQHGMPLFASPYLDVTTAVERLSGLTALYLDVLQDFINALDGVEAEFRQAAAQGQMALLLSQMHTLKGTAATLGAMPLSVHAARLEERFRNPAPAWVVLDELPALLELVQASQSAGLQALQCLRAAEVQALDNAAAPAAPPDRAAARALLLELSELLRASNLAVLERFAQQRATLSALPPAAVEQLHQALQALDLDLALQLCEAHGAELALP